MKVIHVLMMPVNAMIIILEPFGKTLGMIVLSILWFLSLILFLCGVVFDLGTVWYTVIGVAHLCFYSACIDVLMNREEVDVH